MKLFKRNKLNNKGFTFIELIVTIAIIAIVSSIFLLSQKSVNGSQKLEMSAQKLASDLRQMQSYVLNLQDHNGSFPDGGWGIRFQKTSGNNTSYSLYADDNSDRVLGAGEQYLDNIALPGGVYIEELWLDDHTSTEFTPNNLFVTFEPPDPRVWICRNAGQCNPDPEGVKAEITLSNSDNTIERVIEINKYGLIDVQD